MKKLYFFFVAFLMLSQAHPSEFSKSPIGDPITSEAVLITPTFNPVGPICYGSTAPTLPSTSTNGITGTWSPSVIDNTVTASYTFTPNVGQDATSVTIQVVVNPLPEAPLVSVIQPSCTVPTGICILPSGPGNLYSIDGGPFTNVNFFDELLPGVHVVLAQNQFGCISPLTSFIVNPQPATPSAPTVMVTQPNCAVPTGTITINGIPGEIYALDGQPYSATLVYSGLAAGSSHTITAMNAAGCISATTFITIGFASQPNAGIDGATTVCDSSTTPIDLFSLITGEQAGGVWTRTAGNGGTFIAAAGIFTPAPGAVSSAFTYTIDGISPCVSDSSVAIVTINSQPSAGVLSGNQIICVGFTTTFAASASGGTWSSSNNAIATVNATTGVVTGVNAGNATITYTVNGAVPCLNATATRTVTVNVAQTLTLFCDAAQATSPNSVFIDWGNIAGSVNYQYSYAINSGPIVTGTTGLSNYEVFGVQPGQLVVFTITNVSGAPCTSLASITCGLPLATDRFEDADFIYAPNPVRDVLNLTYTEPIKNVAMYNILGQQVLYQYSNSMTLAVNVTELSGGIYMVKVQTANGSKVFKVIKE